MAVTLCRIYGHVMWSHTRSTEQKTSWVVQESNITLIRNSHELRLS